MGTASELLAEPPVGWATTSSADFAAIGAYAAEDPSLAAAIRHGLEDSRTAVERTPAGITVQQTLQAAYARAT